jgi:hypothetical protein
MIEEAAAVEGGSVSDNRDEFLFLLGVQKGMTFENIEKLLDDYYNCRENTNKQKP